MFKYILLCLIAFSGYYAWTIYPISHGPGELAPDKPKFEYLRDTPVIEYQSYSLQPKMKFSGQVRVLSKKRYFLDEFKSISPYDIVIGWGEMSDERNIEFIKFRLDSREANLDYIRPPLPEKSIYEQAELIHIIPSSEEISTTISQLKQGSIIKIEGLYVDAESENSLNWSTYVSHTVPTRFENIVFWVTKIEEI